MDWRRVLCIAWSVALFAGAVFAQSGNKPSTAGQKPTIRVGIPLMSNRSRRDVIPEWERNQLVRELQRLRSDRKALIVVEAVPLEATSREDASPKAAKKSCQFLVLTTLLDVSRAPRMSAGPGGAQPAPIVIGNANPERAMDMDFTILEVSAFRTLVEGSTSVAVEDDNDIRAADEAMRTIARRIVSELGEDRPRFD